MKLTAEKLRELLHYDPDTGVFTWQTQVSQRCPPGSRAGSLTSKGYITIQIDGRTYHAARLAHLYMTGEWPSLFMDHRDRRPENNSWLNLRQATRAQNNQNRGRVSRPARSGAMGVYRQESGRWKAMIGVSGRYLNLGTFDTVEDASFAYQEAKRQHHVA